jgi:hypothetical protein
MLDTVVLTLGERHFEIVIPQRFSPSAEGLFKPPYYPLGARGIFCCVQNPTKTDLRSGNYQPRLTLIRRRTSIGFLVTLKIEFSAPKILFGNNFEELVPSDFEAVIETLHRKLGELGVSVPRPVLRQASVSAIHYSKNIALTDFATCSMVMSELGRVDLSKRFDLARTVYRNEGHAVRYHTNDFEVTFYDKIRDLRAALISPKRGLERDYGPEVAAQLWKRGLEVLRMEVRLGSRRKIRRTVQEAGFGPDLTFEHLFDAELSKEVLGLIWRRIRVQLLLVNEVCTRNPEAIIGRLAAAANGQARIGKLLQLLGIVVLLGAVGPRATSAVLSKYCHPRSSQRLKQEIRSLPIIGAKEVFGLQQVEEALREFAPMRVGPILQSTEETP